MIKKTFLLLSLSLCVSGCSVYGTLEPLPEGEQQQTMYMKGDRVLTSAAGNFVSILVPRVIESGEPFAVTVQTGNGGAAPYDFSPANITSGFQTPQGNDELHVYTLEELQDQIHTRARIATFLYALAGVANAYSASMSAGTSTTTGSFSGNYTANMYNYGSGYTNGYGDLNGTYTQETYNPWERQQAVAAADAQMQANIVSVAQSSGSLLNALSEKYLQINTVMPGTTTGGRVSIDGFRFGSDGGTVEFIIRAGEETHRLKFKVIKIDQ